MKYESPITYHSKDMTYVKGFCRQTNRQANNYMPPIFRYGGIKIKIGQLFWQFTDWEFKLQYSCILCKVTEISGNIRFSDIFGIPSFHRCTYQWIILIKCFQQSSKPTNINALLTLGVPSTWAGNVRGNLHTRTPLPVVWQQTSTIRTDWWECQAYDPKPTSTYNTPKYRT
jgi:hypothetical protein